MLGRQIYVPALTSCKTQIQIRVNHVGMVVVSLFAKSVNLDGTMSAHRQMGFLKHRSQRSENGIAAIAFSQDQKSNFTRSHDFHDTGTKFRHEVKMQ